MSSNSYNPYNYNYQQSAPQQQYSTYQTASATNNPPQASASVSRQYQPTTQAADYGFYQAHSYGTHGNGYDAAQDRSGTWNSTSYGANRETTSRAAEVLHNMSNTAHSSNSTNQSTFPSVNAAPAPRYTTAPMSSRDQSQARPPSVNTNRAQASAARGNNSPALPTSNSSQRPAKSYSQNQFNQPQRTASPAQYKSSQPQYSTEHSNRQLPNPTYYSYSASHATAPISQTTTTAPESMGQTTTTVDPMAVYDPWPEYQRKAEAQKAQKAIEDAARLEEEKKAEQRRQDGEQKRQEEERRKAQEEAKRKKEEEEQERRRQEEERARSAQMARTQQGDSQRQTASSEPTSNAMEDEIRALMSKMREFNSKDPALLARIWEEECRAKAPKSPTVQSKPTPQAAAPPPQTQTPPTATPRQSAASMESVPPKAAKPTKISKAKATPVPAQPIAKPVESPTINRPKGSTVWPPEKKAHLASAAASYLSAHEPNRPVEANEILLMLDRNPSYIELCEQLEQIGLVLERAAFAKTLLAAVPDVNSGSRPKPGPAGPVNAPQRVQVATPAIMKSAAVRTPATPAGQSQAETPGLNTTHYPPFPENNAPVAEMIPINPEQRHPPTKEEAARKRTFGDLVDLTQMPDDEDEPALKKHDPGRSHQSPFSPMQNASELQEGSPANFPLPAHTVARPAHQAPPPFELRHQVLVQPLDRKNALRRNTYNIKTIARDVLLACGRHPDTRQLNQHLDILKTTLPQITNDADLSTLRWDLIDPGNAPAGYFKEDVHDLAADADDEDDSDEEDRVQQSHGPSATSAVQKRPQAPVEALNPFQPKRRGRPPRSSLPGEAAPSTPKQRPVSTTMAASAPHPSTTAAGVGYSAFRSATQYDADGNPLPKKRGRPVGWRKSLHGSAAALTHSNPNGYTGPRPLPHNSRVSMPLNSGTGSNPIRLDSRSPSVVPGYKSFKCKWQGCVAELHNLETLRKHVFKVHRKESPSGMLECSWNDCADVASHDPLSNMRIESAKTFARESDWQEHLVQTHFQPLAWTFGDGQAGGVSDTNDSEAYLSDAQGRSVTPRIIRPEYLSENGYSDSAEPAPQRKRPKDSQEQDARGVQDRMISRKKRIGGPGMDRGGSTFVNEKRRRGFVDVTDTEEEIVDAES
ncbi:hypothetical protein DM02DRAFT_5167 [Periconia macrospinosa]|uniref:C2H2-type domain-containing protein n=1 Tax=Periconia macrospinosa TaxID=97972 RepID=A0A2V1EEQ2_9PLEO|nr:hypothetical protein DM02DRAFT_5167 [Periconia macrospinosa]